MAAGLAVLVFGGGLYFSFLIWVPDGRLQRTLDVMALGAIALVVGTLVEDFGPRSGMRTIFGPLITVVGLVVLAYGWFFYSLSPTGQLAGPVRTMILGAIALVMGTLVEDCGPRFGIRTIFGPLIAVVGLVVLAYGWDFHSLRPTGQLAGPVHAMILGGTVTAAGARVVYKNLKSS